MFAELTRGESSPGSKPISRMSQALGADESTTGNAVQAAFAMLLGALAHSSTPIGASSLLGALDRDLDGPEMRLPKLRRPVTKRNVLIGARLFFGLLTLAAIATQLVIQIQRGLSVVMRHREPSAMDDIIRGTSVMCMALVVIVFTVLLRNLDLGHLLPWVNAVTHYIMPVVVMLDWLYQPPLSKLAVKQISYWLIFPLRYLAYSVSRGAIVGFYAYPFLNPDKVGGYGGVVFYCVSIIAVFLFVSWVLLTLGNKLRRNVA
jgi:Bacterial protein of unknown function (DUF937)